MFRVKYWFDVIADKIDEKALKTRREHIGRATTAYLYVFVANGCVNERKQIIIR